MAGFRNRERTDAGYATPAAMVLGLALALVATAFVDRSTMSLRLAKADLERAIVEYGLDGAHLLAAATIVRAGDGGPYRWALSTNGEFAESIAERETDKLDLSSMTGPSDSVLDAMGVENKQALRARLAVVAADALVDVAQLDAAPLWRECAPSMISSLGRATTASTAPHVEPPSRPDDPDWRVGEVWRVRITASSGWRDDRLVRFTGDANHPVAVVHRNLSRSNREHGQCDAILAAR